MTWVAQVPGDVLWTLLQGLSGSEGIVTAGSAYQAVLDELWRRFGTPISDWPISTTRASPVSTFIEYCTKATGPDDPEHRPQSRLISEDGECVFNSCTCGVRDNDVRFVAKIYRRRRQPGTAGWPVEYIEGVPYFIMCPYAEFADDLDHGLLSEPWEGAYFCICNCTYGRSEDSLYKVAKAMPAQ